MADGQEALGELQRDIERLRRELETRLGELSRPAPAPAGFWAAFKEGIDVIVRIASAATPVAVLVVGVMITDVADRALKEREVEVQESRLDLDATTTMEHLLDRLRQPNIGIEEARTTALLVAGYGVHAILPLVLELDLPPEKFARVEAAKQALRAMALSPLRRAALCDTLASVLRFSVDGAFFENEGLRHTAELSGTLKCPEARAPLQDLLDAGPGDADLAKALRGALTALEP